MFLNKMIEGVFKNRNTYFQINKVSFIPIVCIFIVYSIG